MASRKKKTDTSEIANSDTANRLRRGTYERLLPMDPPIQLFDGIDDYEANADALIEHIGGLPVRCCCTQGGP